MSIRNFKEWGFAFIVNLLSLGVFVCLIIMIVSGQVRGCANNNDIIQEPDKIPDTVIPIKVASEGDNIEKLFFNIANVCTTYEEDSIYYCLYEDPDGYDDIIKITMSERVFNILEDVVFRASEYDIYTKEWCEIEEEYVYLLYHDKILDTYRLGCITREEEEEKEKEEAQYIKDVIRNGKYRSKSSPKANANTLVETPKADKRYYEYTIR